MTESRGSEGGGVADALRSVARSRPRAVTAVASAIGYALVVGVLWGPLRTGTLADETVVLLGDLIAVVNLTALAAMLLGVRFVRRGEIRRHRAAMLTAFGLVLVFLALYLTKLGGGFEKHIVIESGMFLAAYEGVIYPAYLLMLAVHIVLSAAAVPLVIHAVVLGLSRSQAELRDSAHPRVGRWAVLAWSTSLALGVLTYVLLNHVYAWEAGTAAAVVLAAPAPRRD
ncbi:MAG: DUF420 domain-containing protein [Halobacteriaceae archaeon]